MASVLLYGDTIRMPELRHEVPVAVIDPFLYVEPDGRRVAVMVAMEIERTRGATNGDLEILPLERFGWDEIIRTAGSIEEADLELALRACRELGVERAVVPGTFPLGLADALRAAGVELRVDDSEFERRRRVKKGAELDGIRRAQRAADAAFAAVAEMLREAGGDEQGLELEGAPLTSERLRRRAEDVLAEHGASGEELVIASHGAQTADGHEMGYGQILRGEPIAVDIFPRDRASGCYADSTRTFCVGEPPALLVELHTLCMEALRRSLDAVRPGVTGRELHRIACAVFEEAGWPTQLSKSPDEPLFEGFFHSLGHGVGLGVHEAPYLGRSGGEIVAGDVIAIEPGCYRRDFGGCRIEDLVLVTDDGPETLTKAPYDLAP